MINITVRSRAFSQLLGLIFVGMSVGPILTGYIMRTTGLLLPVFYATAMIDSLVALSAWFIIPESLSVEDMQKRRAEQVQALQGTSPLKQWLSTFDVISPLAVLLPRRVERSGHKYSIDWTMTILSAAYGFGTSVQAALYQQIQYASLVFHWSSGVVSAHVMANPVARTNRVWSID